METRGKISNGKVRVLFVLEGALSILTSQNNRLVINRSMIHNVCVGSRKKNCATLRTENRVLVVIPWWKKKRKWSFGWRTLRGRRTIAYVLLPFTPTSLEGSRFVFTKSDSSMCVWITTGDPPFLSSRVLQKSFRPPPLGCLGAKRPLGAPKGRERESIVRLTPRKNQSGFQKGVVSSPEQEKNESTFP